MRSWAIAFVCCACSQSPSAPDSGLDAGKTDALSEAATDASSGDSSSCGDVSSDPENCGACGHVCGTANGTASCVAGKCNIACAQGHGDCDQSTDNGCEADLSTDQHCGACDRDCQGGGCSVNQLCNPIPLGTDSTALGIALDATNVYWTDYDLTNGSIRQCAKAGCNMQPTVLATAQPGPLSIAVDGSNVYWINKTAGDIQKCAIGGCGMQPATLVGGQANVFGVATDGTNVYFTTSANNGEIRSCAVGGCGGTPSLFTPSGYYNPSHITIAGGNAVWGTNLGVFACPLAGCSNSPIQLGPYGTNDPDIFGTDAYWADMDIRTCPVGGCNNAPKTVVKTVSVQTNVVVDGTNVYWGDTGKNNLVSLKRCSLTSCTTPTVLMDVFGGTNAGYLAVDSKWVYVTTGTVVKVAK